MADSLLDNYNPLYDVHLRQYFALPHMQKHLRNIGLLQADDNEDCDDETQLYARHHAMMDLMLRNRETQLAKLADVQKKLDAAEKVEICRKIRSGATSPESHRRAKPSRSLSRGRFSASKRQRRSSTSTDDKDLIKKIETENEEPQTGDPHYVYNRLSACVGKYRYLHKLDDETLSAYMEQLRRQLNKLERFREVSFGPHSVARHQSEPHVSWFFRRRSLPSLSDSEQANALHEPLRSVQSLKFRNRLGKSTSPRKLNESHDSRATYPLTSKRRRNSESTRLPPIGRNGNSGPSSGSSGAQKVPSKNRTVSSKRRSNSRKRDEPVRMQKVKPKDEKSDALPTLAVVGVPALAGGAAAAAAGLSSSMNPATPIPTALPTGMPSQELPQPEGGMEDESTVAEEEKSGGDQIDEQLPSSTPHSPEDESAMETTDNSRHIEERKQETMHDDFDQQQKTPDDRIMLQESGDAQNSEVPEEQMDTGTSQPAAVKAESPPQMMQPPVSDQNGTTSGDQATEGEEAEVEVEPQQMSQSGCVALQESDGAQSNEISEEQMDTGTSQPEAVKAESPRQMMQPSISDQNGTTSGDQATEGEEAEVEVEPQQMSQSGCGALQESDGVQNKEISEEKMVIGTSEPEAVKTESLRQMMQPSIGDQNGAVSRDQATGAEEGEAELQPQQTSQSDTDTSEMQLKSLVLEPDSSRVETELERAPLSIAAHQPLPEMPDTASEQLEEKSSSLDEGDASEEKGRTADEETEDYTSSNQDSCAAEGAESNYGGTTPTASRELSHEDENAGDVVPPSQKDVDGKGAKETEDIEEPQVEHEEIREPESFTPLTEGSSEITDGPKAGVEAQTTLPESSVGDPFCKQNDNTDIGNLAEQRDEAQTHEKAELSHEPAAVNYAVDNIEVQNGSVQSSDADETQKISEESGAMVGSEKVGENQSSGRSLDISSPQERILSSSAPAEPLSKIQKSTDEQSTVADSALASPASVETTEHIAEPEQLSCADMAHQSPTIEEVSNVETASGGLSWEVKGENRNESESDICKLPKSAADDETLEQSEIQLSKDEDDTENAVDAVKGDVCDDTSGVVDEQADRSPEVTEVSKARRERSAASEERSTNVSGSEGNSPEPLSRAEQASAGTEAGSPRPTSMADETIVEQSRSADENNDAVSDSDGLHLEEAPRDTLSEMNDASIKAEAEEKTQTQAADSNEIEKSETSKKGDERVEEAAQHEVLAVEAGGPSQDRNQQQPSTASHKSCNAEQIPSSPLQQPSTASDGSHSAEQMLPSPLQASEDRRIKQEDNEPNALVEGRNGMDTAEAEGDLADHITEAHPSSPKLQSSDMEEKQRINGTEGDVADAKPNGSSQVSGRSVQESELTTGECDDHALSGDREVPAINASEKAAQMDAESSNVEGNADVDREVGIEKAQGGLDVETVSEEESQKERNLFDENANHPDTVDGEQTQQILGNKTNGNTTNKSDEEKMQLNGQSMSPLQKPSNTIFEASDGDSQGVGGDESKAVAATLMHQTTEAEEQSSV